MAVRAVLALESPSLGALYIRVPLGQFERERIGLGHRNITFRPCGPERALGHRFRALGGLDGFHQRRA